MKPLDSSHPTWMWFLMDATKLSEEKLKTGRSLIKAQPCVRKQELAKALVEFGEQLLGV
jgi:hypothetical protein